MTPLLKYQDVIKQIGQHQFGTVFLVEYSAKLPSLCDALFMSYRKKSYSELRQTSVLTDHVIPYCSIISVMLNGVSRSIFVTRPILTELQLRTQTDRLKGQVKQSRKLLRDVIICFNLPGDSGRRLEPLWVTSDLHPSKVVPALYILFPRRLDFPEGLARMTNG